jgi:hypothetical protein
MLIYPYIITIAGCIVLRDSLYRHTGTRICHRAKINTQTPTTDLTDCTLEKEIANYSDFSVCPFCANSIYSYQEHPVQAVTPQSIEPDTLTAFCLTDNPDASNSQWIVGYIVDARRVETAPTPFREIESVWNNKVRPRLVEQLLWRDVSFGFYTIVSNITASI